jgi:hypothetical protein
MQVPESTRVSPTGESINAAQQLFMYFCGTLIALMFVAPQGADR